MVRAGVADIIVLNSGQPNQLYLNDGSGRFTEASHKLKTQQIGYDPANPEVELGNWGSKEMAFVCEIDADPDDEYQACDDGGESQLLDYFGVQTCAEAVLQFPCDSVRGRSIEGVFQTQLLSALCPLRGTRA